MRTRTIITIACGLVAMASLSAPAEEARTVSPGAADRFAEVVGRCPTFSWAAEPGAGAYELVVYRVPEQTDGYRPTAGEPTDLEEVLFEWLPQGATGWTPERGRCFEPRSSYVWFVRAAPHGGGETSGEDFGWSAGRYFAVSGQPSSAEIEEALEVLQRYSAGVADAPPNALLQHQQPAGAPPRSRLDTAPIPVPPSGLKHVTTTATASIRGEMLDPSGEAYGVIGISNSSNGAGVGAGNTNNGPDLVLDGSEDGNDPDAVFTQAGIDRNSSTADTMFFLLNSDDNKVLNLHVEGSIQFAAEGTDGGLFFRDPATGDLHLQVNSPKMMIDIGGGTRVTIDNTGAVTIDGTTITVQGDTLNLTGDTQLTLSAPNIDITAGLDLDLEGLNINATASAKVDIEGTMADLSGSAMTTIVGGIVKIN